MMYAWLVDDRLSSYAIAKKLWEEGILSKGDFSQCPNGHGEWSPATVRKMLSNPVYKGQWCYGKTRLRGSKGKKVKVESPSRSGLSWTFRQSLALGYGIGRKGR